jgi:phosphoserine aminotransferase
MTNRVFNFSAGPCILPLPILEQAAAELVDFKGAGMSIIEMSHRGKHYDEVHHLCLTNLREVLAVPESHDILLLQGGATLQFAMVPLNLIVEGKTAEYTFTGTWAKKAIADSKKIGPTRVIWSGEEEKFTRMPKADELKIGADAAYLHITGNETIGGIEWHEYPDTGDVPLVSDGSSHVLSRAVDWSRTDLLYAGAQKNLGPAGVALIVIRKDLIDVAGDDVPAYLAYRTHAPKESMYNTPPVFPIYMMNLDLMWVKAQGGLPAMEQLAIERSQMIYKVVDESGGWFSCPVDKASRSRMNVVWRLPTEDLEKQMVAEGLAAGMTNLKGHRSVGGCRASMYNAMPVEGAAKLAQFMVDFKKANS